MDPTIVNAKPRYRPPTLVDPPGFGYLLLSAEVEPPTGPRPFPGSSDTKTALLGRLKSAAAELAQIDAVERATVYRTVLAPPPAGYARKAQHPARYDVVVLVETTSPDGLTALQAAEPYAHLRKEFDTDATRVDTMPARCVKCIADVDKSRPGLFLFNYFVADDVEVALKLWDHLAGWFMTETGLDNSTLLMPTGESEYAFVNHARWDYGLPQLWLRMFTKPSFWSFVQANMNENRVGSMPILCRLA
ncbi:MAG TPA: hypothetical protein VFH30_11620 [Acidimicrobiales bacterium]|nr:hypothetical protein [Acidimicrobiales bacterium]